MGFNDLMTKLFGNKAQRDIKAIRPFVMEVNNIYPTLAALSNDELRQKTQQLKQDIQDAAADLRNEIKEVKDQIEKTEIQNRAPLFEKIDKLEEEVLKVFDKKLDEIMPLVYAIVKDTCRRFREAKTIEDLALTPTDFDREAVLRYPGVVEIKDDKVLIHEVFDGAPNIWIP
ncbi:MAG: preprotein translocase subunit SecA, partial [Bacteroidaceae bacterium]|nr:preprotein translocase subunit SecA [Bacteroidaceae bacterium]